MEIVELSLGSSGSDDERARKLNGCARSLRFAKMRSTGVRAGGVRALLAHAAALEGVRCSNYDVLQVSADFMGENELQLSPSHIKLLLKPTDV